MVPNHQTVYSIDIISFFEDSIFQISYSHIISSYIAILHIKLYYTCLYPVFKYHYMGGNSINGSSGSRLGDQPTHLVSWWLEEMNFTMDISCDFIGWMVKCWDYSENHISFCVFHISCHSWYSCFHLTNRDFMNK